MHDVGEVGGSLQLLPGPGGAAGEALAEELVEGAQAVLLQQLQRVEEADGQSKVALDRSRLGQRRRRRGRGREMEMEMEEGEIEMEVERMMSNDER